MSPTMRVGVRLSADFYRGNAAILHPWRENLIKQCDSAVRATPACVVDAGGAPPCSAARPHTGGDARDQPPVMC